MGDGPILDIFGDLNYLWGNIPAIDLLNLGQNEGQVYSQDLDLCFAASGDPRNLMCSINGLPATYAGSCTSLLNDKNMNIVARNVAILLITAQLPPFEAAELILHLWYSARLTRDMLAAVKKHVREPIADVSAKIQNKADDIIQSKKWTFRASEINVRLYKPQWSTLLKMLDAEHSLEKTEQERRKVVLAPSRIDWRDRELYTLPGPRPILPRALPAQTCASGFDRIEVSNIADDAYVGLSQTLATFAPLLKAPNINPHATLLTLFLNACEIADRVMGNDKDPAVLRKQTDQVLRYLHLNPFEIFNLRNDPHNTFKVIAAKDLVRDYDRIFKSYMDAVDFAQCAENAGLQMKERNTVVEAWPMRLKKKPGEPGADEEFNLLLASSCSGAERYVEWARKKK